MPPRRPKDLPDFANPPITELALSVQFAPLTNLRNIHIGLLWRLLRKKYPNVEEHPLIATIFETFGLPIPATAAGVQLQLLNSLDLSHRYWFVSSQGDHLFQIQRDRIAHNWRKQREDETYPRYEPLRARFLSEVQLVERFLKDENLGAILPNQCEITYINHISLDGCDDPADRLDEIFTNWHENYSDNFLQRIERAQFNMTFVIPSDAGKAPFGRLHVSVQPAMHRETSTRLVQFTLVCRGKPDDETIGSALEWLDGGRAVVVKAFATLTEPDMHQAWGRKDDAR